MQDGRPRRGQPCGDATQGVTVSTVIICADPRLAHDVGRAVLGAKVMIRDVREAIREPRPLVRAYVIVRRRLDRKGVAEIEALRRGAADRPVVLVTDPDPEPLRCLCHVRLAGIVWWDDRARELPDILASVDIRSLAVGFAMSVQEMPRAVEYAHLTDAIDTLCRLGPPVPSTDNFAALAFVSPSTLRRQLRSLLGQDWTPKSLFETVGVLMTLDLLRRGWRMRDVLNSLGVHEDTLRSWARRRHDESIWGLLQQPERALDRARRSLGRADDAVLEETAGQVDRISGSFAC